MKSSNEIVALDLATLSTVHGIAFECTFEERDPGCGPSYSHGGIPPSGGGLESVDAFVEIQDAEEFAEDFADAEMPPGVAWVPEPTNLDEMQPAMVLEVTDPAALCAWVEQNCAEELEENAEDDDGYED